MIIMNDLIVNALSHHNATNCDRCLLISWLCISNYVHSNGRMLHSVGRTPTQSLVIAIHIAICNTNSLLQLAFYIATRIAASANITILIASTCSIVVSESERAVFYRYVPDGRMRPVTAEPYWTFGLRVLNMKRFEDENDQKDHKARS